MNVSLNESGDGTRLVVLVGGRGAGHGAEDIVVVAGNVVLGDADVSHGKIRVPSTCFHSKSCVGGHR